MDLIEATHAIKRSPFLILNQLCAKRVNTQFILVQRVQRFFSVRLSKFGHLLST